MPRRVSARLDLLRRPVRAAGRLSRRPRLSLGDDVRARECLARPPVRQCVRNICARLRTRGQVFRCQSQTSVLMQHERGLPRRPVRSRARLSGLVSLVTINLFVVGLSLVVVLDNSLNAG